MPEAVSFQWVALDRSGRRSKGLLEAETQEAAYAVLRGKGLSPLSLGPAASKERRNFFSSAVNDRDAAEFAADLAALLKAGADMRSALNMLADRSDHSRIKTLAENLLRDISGGGSVGSALRKHLSARQGFISSLVSAGEQAGGIAPGLQRASEMLNARIKLRDQIVGTLSYPAFVLLTTVGALGAILLFVIPTLAPLIEETGGSAPIFLKLTIALSSFLNGHLVLLSVGFLGLLALGAFAWRGGYGAAAAQAILLDRVGRRTIRGLVFGGFAVTLGGLLSGGSSMSDALRLAIESVDNRVARSRLDQAELLVRQGEKLSDALERVRGFPPAIARLAMVGEASGSLGEMLVRAGAIEEEKAIRRLEAASRIMGPALIIVLGGAVGLLMAGLLSGISQLGNAAIQ